MREKRSTRPRAQRGPLLCGAENGYHPALNAQVVTSGPWRRRVVCANCALRRFSDAMRADPPEAFASEPYDLALAHDGGEELVDVLAMEGRR